MVVEVLRVWVDLQIRLYNGGLLFQPRATKFSVRENESFLSTLTSTTTAWVDNGKVRLRPPNPVVVVRIMDLPYIFISLYMRYV